LSDLLVAIVLGLVEGITEFLPISSTGHLILVGHWLRFTGEKANAFEIFIQLGAILAVVGYFRQRLWCLLRNVWGGRASRAIVGKIPEGVARRFIVAVMVAFLPAAILGGLLHDAVVAALFTPKTVAAALIVGGLGILFIERFRPAPRTVTMEHLSWRQAFWIGMAQCLSFIPGMSRSASTIMGALVVGVDHAPAAEFSFFLAIPTMIAATLYSLFKVLPSLSAADGMQFAIGFLVSLLAAWLVIAAFMAFIQRHSFVIFGWYRIVFGVVLLGMMANGWM